MEIITTLAGPWPLATLIICIVALFLFRQPLVHFLQRANEFGLGGFKASSNVQGQRQVETQPPLSKVDELMKACQSPLLIETEDLIKANLDQVTTDPVERQKVLVKVLAASQIQIFFERAYFAIFGSQLAALQFLNSSPGTASTIDALRPFYDRAKIQEAEFYRTYEFDNWLGFLQTQLFLKIENDKVILTVRGREFLKYLIEQGYSFNKSG